MGCIEKFLGGYYSVDLRYQVQEMFWATCMTVRDYGPCLLVYLQQNTSDLYLAL